MATPSTDSLAGLMDPAMMRKGEGAEERMREEDLKLTSRELSELLRVDKEEQVRGWSARFLLSYKLVVKRKNALYFAPSIALVM